MTGDLVKRLRDPENNWNSGGRFEAAARIEALEAAQKAIKDALGTDENGEALIEVARNAHRAEQELAAIQRKQDGDSLEAAAAQPSEGRIESKSEAAELSTELFDAIEHGDDIHREWLKEALENWFAGKPVPPPRSAAAQPSREAERPSAGDWADEEAAHLMNFSLENLQENIAVTLRHLRDEFLAGKILLREAALVKAARDAVDHDLMENSSSTDTAELAKALRLYDTPATPDAVKRPDWKAIYEDCAKEDADHVHDNDLVTVTRETVELASHALRKQNQDEYYHNYGAAERELMAILHPTPATPDAGREVDEPPGKWEDQDYADAAQRGRT